MPSIKQSKYITLIIWLGILAVSAFLNYGKFVRHGYTLNAVNGIAALTVIAIFFTILFLLFEILLRVAKVRQSLKTNLRISLISIFAIVLMIEISLRIAGKNATYGENGFTTNYYTFYQTNQGDWFHLWTPFEEHEFSGQGEFRSVRKANSLGLCEEEISKEKPDGELRVIALGDSFTEGVGASYDSTWVKQLEHILNDSIDSKVVKCINAGIAGSDPVFGYILLREMLVDYNPDIVIQTINFTDEGDIFVKGGTERFHDNNELVLKKGPKWEPIFALSYIFRLYIRDYKGYEDVLIDPAERPGLERKAVKQIDEVLTESADIAKEHDFYYLAVFHPMWNETGSRSYEGNLKYLIARLDSSEVQTYNYVDLMPYYTDVRGLTEDNVFDYYWKEYHHNPKGYKLMADGIAKKILEDGIW